MFRVTEKQYSIAFELSSEMRLVDRTILEAQEFLKLFEVSDTAKFKLVLREMLNNAIGHGNKNTIAKTVSCSITYLNPLSSPPDTQNKQFRIDVQDEGGGFDYNNLDFSLPEDPKKIRNRGFILINALSDEIQFNETGNQVSVTITCSEDIDLVTPFPKEKERLGSI